MMISNQKKHIRQKERLLSSTKIEKIGNLIMIPEVEITAKEVFNKGHSNRLRSPIFRSNQTQFENTSWVEKETNYCDVNIDLLPLGC